ncbi:hypothetical protein [Burkholderia pseudomallei]|uniref:hypothetical protein n=2 Tax=Burkholderia TaxID=32008 RepID=UPI000903FC01|nr:hypothetical protein [Burkholderia pseudomallei]
MRTWTDDQLANYETALETVGNVIAIASRDIAAERQKSQPDADRINELLILQRRLNQERHSLRIDDDAAVRKAVGLYSKIVRAGHLGTTPSGTAMGR